MGEVSDKHFHTHTHTHTHIHIHTCAHIQEVCLSLFYVINIFYITQGLNLIISLSVKETYMLLKIRLVHKEIVWVGMRKLMFSFIKEHKTQ